MTRQPIPVFFSLVWCRYFSGIFLCSLFGLCDFSFHFSVAFNIMSSKRRIYSLNKIFVVCSILNSKLCKHLKFADAVWVFCSFYVLKKSSGVLQHDRLLADKNIFAQDSFPILNSIVICVAVVFHGISHKITI